MLVFPGVSPNRGAAMFLKTMLPTPLGPMLAVASAVGLCGLEFDEPERATRLWTRLQRWRPGEAVREGHAPVFDATARWLGEYFAGRYDAVAQTASAAEVVGSGAGAGARVTLDLVGTEFERAVWRALADIRYGQTTTYGAIAATLCRTAAARAVGAAVGANPVSLLVPCHRVIGTSGSLTGYGGGLERKEWLLRHEGALLL